MLADNETPHYERYLGPVFSLEDPFDVLSKELDTSGGQIGESGNVKKVINGLDRALDHVDHLYEVKKQIPPNDIHAVGAASVLLSLVISERLESEFKMSKPEIIRPPFDRVISELNLIAEKDLVILRRNRP